MMDNAAPVYQGPDPLEEMPVAPLDGIPEDTRYLGQKLDELIDLTKKQAGAIEGAQKPAPGNYWAMPGVHNDFPQAVRLRVTDLLVSISAAAIVTVRIGSAPFATYEFSGAGTTVLPFSTVIDRGIDVSVAVSAGVLRSAYFVGTPDEAAG